MATAHPISSLFYLAAKGLIRSSEGKILLLHDTPRSRADGTTHTYWDLPGGRVDNSESLEVTLAREMHEEIGLEEFEVEKLLSVTQSNWQTPLGDLQIGLVLVVYICRAQIEDVVLSDEHDQFGWFSPPEAAELLSIKYPQSFTEQIALLAT